jgi:hypothetical protein
MNRTDNINRIYTLDMSIDAIEADIKKGYNNINVSRDPHLRMFAELVRELEEGRKIVTIRFLKDSVRIPDVDDTYSLSVMQTTPENWRSGPIVGKVQIPQIYVSTVAKFPKEYFRLDGYPTKKVGLEDISEIYNHKLKPTDLLSMYWLENFERI